MEKFIVAIFLMFLLCSTLISQESKQTTEKKHYIYTLKLVPHLMEEKNWTKQDKDILEKHINGLKQLHKNGKAILIGRTLNTSEPSHFGIVILEVNSEEEAKNIMNNDAAVKGKIMTAQLFHFMVAFGL